MSTYKTYDPRTLVQYYKFGALDGVSLEEPEWAYPGIIPPGCSILAGGPKTGKSTMVLNVMVPTVTGLRGFGMPDSETGQSKAVLYLDLEGSKRRMAVRVHAYDRTLRPSKYNDYLTVVTEIPRADAGGLDFIRAWRDDEEQAGRIPHLVIVDTLQCFRNACSAEAGYSYASDYEAVRGLQSISMATGLHFIIICHTTKSSDPKGDFLKDVSGTQGLTGSADNILVMKRKRGTDTATVEYTSRDVPEGKYLLRREGMHWTYLGPVEFNDDDQRKSDTREAVLAWLAREENGGRRTAAEIAKGIGKSSRSEYNALYKVLERMVSDGILERRNGGYIRKGDTRRMTTDAQRHLVWR